MPPTSIDPGAELPRDPRIDVLSLPSGLSTWIFRHPDPAGGLAVALSVAAGSASERPEERGLAHLLEHLAFRGGANLSADDLTRLFERTGTRLGRHHNAATGLDRTTYSLSLPGRDPATLDLAIACLADFARGLEISEAAVASERRVVHEEARGRSSAGRRVRERVLEALLPHARLHELHPLGDPEIVAHATAAQLRAFYRRWYRPDTCTLAVVGEVEPERVEATVRRFLGDWVGGGPAAAVAEVDLGPPTRSSTCVIRELRAAPEARLVSIRRQSGAATVADLRRQLVQSGALWLLGRRLNELVAEGRAAVRDTRLVRSSVIGAWILVEAVAEARAESLEEALAELTAEVARVERHGFTPGELELLARSLRLGAQRTVRRDPQRGAAACLVELLEAIHARLPPPPSPEQRLTLVEEIAGRVDPDETRTALSRQLPSDAMGVLIAAEDASPPRPDARRAQARRDAAAAVVQPPPSRSRRMRLLDQPPPPATVTGRRDATSIGVASLELDGGLVVHLKSLPTSPDRSVVQATWIGGRIEETGPTLGLTAAAALAFANPATRRLASVDIRDALAGTSVAASCSINEDCVSLVLTSDPEELGTSLELLSLLLGEPELEAAALARWRAAMLDERLGRDPGLEERLAVTALALLTGSDPRFAPLLPERAATIERAAAQRWLEEVLGGAPVEVAIVAPAPRADLEAAAVRCLAAPRRRPASRPELEDLRRLAAPETAVAAEITVPSAADRAAVMAGWRGLPYRDSEARAVLHMAVQLLDRRLHRELREERGLTYDPDCSFSPSRAYPAASLLSATFYAPPDRIEEAIAASHRVFEELATHGPTETEMASVRAQFAELAARAELDPRFWARTLAESRYRELDLASLDDLPGRCRRRSSHELQQALARCIRPDRRLTVVCRPGGA